MKVFIFGIQSIIIMTCIHINLRGQTDSIEKVRLYEKVTNKQLTGIDFADKIKKWNETIKKLGGYPAMPFDENGIVQYSFVQNFSSLSSEYLYSRVLEWLAINYGTVPANLYSNIKDGKIICTNSFDASENERCIYTCIISVKEEKLRLEIINIGIQVTQPADGLSIYVPMEKVFPVIEKNSIDWYSTLQEIKSIDEHLKSEIVRISNYIHKSFQNKEF